MSHNRVDREPCPFRIVEDAGGAFVFGLVGGSVYHSFGGARNAPKGQMMQQAFSRVQARVPMLGGSFAVWGTLFSCCDCSLTAFRKKEDPWNAIIAGAATGGILAARAGMKAAGKSAFFGGVILAAIEGLNIAMMRYIMPYFEKQQEQQQIAPDMLEPPIDPKRSSNASNTTSGTSSSGGGSWDTPQFGTTFGGDATSSLLGSNSESAPTQEKPFWKIW